MGTIQQTLSNIFLVILISILNSVIADDRQYMRGELVINSPYAIENRPGTNNAVMFISDIKNNSNNDMKFKGISTSVAEFSEIHSMKNQGGVMKMRRVSHILIPKNETISLKKGNENGYHIMLLNLKRDLKDGDSFNATLRFEKNMKLKVKVKVKKYLSPDHQKK